MLKSLHNKLIASHLGLIIVTFIALTVVFSHLISGYFYRARETELVDKGFEIATLMEEHFSGVRSGSTIQYALNNASVMLDARIMVLDTRGRVVAITPGFKRWIDESLIEMLDLNRLFENHVIIDRGHHALFDVPVISVGVPVASNDRLLGGVFLFSPIKPIDDVVSSVRRLMIYAGIGSILLAAFVGMIISRTISKPLMEMKKAVKQMKEGDFDVKVEANTEDEMAELGQAFNALSQSLKASITELSREKDKFERVVNNMVEGVLAVDGNNKVILVNAKLTNMLEVSKDNLIGLDFSRDKQFSDLLDVIKRVRKTRDEKVVEVHLSDELTVLIHGSPLADESNGVILIFHDVTEMNKVEKLRQEFVGNVSHELRAPLTIIQGYAEAIMDKVAKDKDTEAKYLSNIVDESQRLNRLVTDLLDLSQIQAGGKAPMKRPVTVGKMIGRAVSAFEDQSQEKRINISVDLEPDIPNVEVDSDMIYQSLINLLSNALRYSPEGDIVKVGARKRGDYVEISISDNGPGIPKEDIPRVWERFYKADQARSRGQGGTGLGLAIVKSIIEAHGGKVSVESRNGDTFRIYLPLVQY